MPKSATRPRARLYMLAAGLALALVLGVVSPVAQRLKPADAVDGDVHGHINTAVGPMITAFCTTGGQGGVGWQVDGVRPGWLFSVTADHPAATVDFDVTFFNGAPCGGVRLKTHYNRAGDEYAVVPPNSTSALVTLNTGANADFTYRELQQLADVGPSGHHSPTVVAIVEPNGFNPYHVDFLGSEHPWNKDADSQNDIDFSADPGGYVAGYPAGVTALPIHLSSDPTTMVESLRSQDTDAWNSFTTSDTDHPAHIFRFKDTKIIGAVRFGASFWADNNAHGTRSAAVAAGNIHGTCPECLVVLVAGTSGFKWATQQSWIDVVSNSYESRWNNLPPVNAEGASFTVRDNLGNDGTIAEASRQAAIAGQSVVWAGGNGVLDSWDAPQTTYSSSMKGPDWVVTVGAGNDDGQDYLGSGKPVDISGPGNGYPSTGGDADFRKQTVAGTGTHSGTSNATPVVAGTLAKIIQMGRDLLGDETGGHSGGDVARATWARRRAQTAQGPNWCGAANPTCPLDDGVLSRKEVEQTLFENVLPWPVRVPTILNGPLNSPGGGPAGAPIATTPYGYYYVGHGVVGGLQDPSRLPLVNLHLWQALQGDVAPYPRPAAEHNWMTVDSKCRQHLWPGQWADGYYHGQALQLDPVADALAIAWNDWCQQVPEGAFDQLPDAPTTAGSH
ncbi:MAG: serine protease [Acidimicrobiaceae bacterium]|nr:serine protease [Acidimicrobiaceae bacterium]